jgi:hypothetical protein
VPCHESMLSRQCPVCRADYTPLVLHPFPTDALAQPLQQSFAVRQCLALAVLGQCTVVWSPTQRVASFMLAGKSPNSPYVAAHGFVVPEGLLDIGGAAAAAAGSSDANIEYHFTEGCWCLLDDGQDDEVVQDGIDPQRQQEEVGEAVAPAAGTWATGTNGSGTQRVAGEEGRVEAAHVAGVAAGAAALATLQAAIPAQLGSRGTEGEEQADGDDDNGDESDDGGGGGGGEITEVPQEDVIYTVLRWLSGEPTCTFTSQIEDMGDRLLLTVQAPLVVRLAIQGAEEEMARRRQQLVQSITSARNAIDGATIAGGGGGSGGDDDGDEAMC